MVLGQPVFFGLLCGLAGWLGALGAGALCAGYRPFVDGPPVIAVRPWAVAIAAACTGTAIALRHPAPSDAAVAALVLLALAACTVSDLTLGIVPDLFTLPPLGAMVIIGAAGHDFAPLIWAAAVGIPFALLAWISGGYGMGWGDVKLAAFGGAILGPHGSLPAITIACFAAVVASRVPALRGRPIAFAPYLAGAIGAVMALGATGG
jgi:prepilin signal peptidase PulO-like enzyme (type II secretory pathway)